MVRNDNGRKHIEVRFFDGIFELVRCCYHEYGTPVFRIFDCYVDGEIIPVLKNYKSCFFNLDEALFIMEETGEFEEADRSWMEDQIRFLNKTKLASVYGKMCNDIEEE